MYRRLPRVLIATHRAFHCSSTSLFSAPVAAGGSATHLVTPASVSAAVPIDQPPPPPPPPAYDAPTPKTSKFTDYLGAISLLSAISFLTWYLLRQKKASERRRAFCDALEDEAVICPGEIKELRDLNHISCVIFVCFVCGVDAMYHGAGADSGVFRPQLYRKFAQAAHEAFPSGKASFRSFESLLAHYLAADLQGQKLRAMVCTNLRHAPPSNCLAFTIATSTKPRTPTLNSCRRPQLRSIMHPALTP